MRHIIIVLFFSILAACDFFGVHSGPEEINTIRIIDTEISAVEKHAEIQIFLGTVGRQILENYEATDFFICTSNGINDYILEGDAIDYKSDLSSVPDDVISQVYDDEIISTLRFSLPAGSVSGPALVGTDEFLREFHLSLERR